MKLFQSNSDVEEKLKKCSYISISEEKKQDLKKKLFITIKEAALNQAEKAVEEIGFEALIQKIKQLAAQILPSDYFRMLLREKLIAIIEFQPVIYKRFFTKKVFAGVLAFVFLFTIVFNFTFKIERAQASFLTTLDETTGDVTIIRDGETLPGVSGFTLKTDDIVRTGEDSKAVIRFLDQSVSRLDENTEIKLSRLFVNSSNKAETFVEVVLTQGRLWARVINLIDNLSRFQIKSKNTVAVVKKRAAFNVAVSDKGKTKIDAIKNKVDIVVATDETVVKTSLTNGFTAEVKGNGVIDSPQILSENIKQQSDEWVKENLAKDEVYIETVKQEVRDQLGDQAKILPGNPLYAVKELSEGAKIILTLDELEKQKKILIAAQEKFSEAKMLLEKGDKEKAADLISGFQSQIKETLEWLKQFEINNSSEALKFKTEIIETLNLYEKQLAVLLPDDPLYSLKEAVSQIKVSVAQGPVEKNQEMLSQAGQKLLEAHDLVEKGDVGAAIAQVQAYSETMSQVVEGVKDLSSENKEEMVTTLLDKKVDDLKVLEAIATPPPPPPLPPPPATLIPPLPIPDAQNSVAGDPNTPLSSETLPQITATDTQPSGSSSAALKEEQQLKASVSEAKKEVLTNIGAAVLEVQKDSSGPEMLQKLQDIKQIDVNGKSLVKVNVMQNMVSLRSEGKIIFVKSEEK